MSAPSLFRVCTEITPQCTLEGTIYGYYPSLAGNAFLLAWFALCLVVNIIFGIRFKTWTYAVVMTLGCICEILGYIGRLMLYQNPYDHVGFQIQIVTLIIAPAFFAAAIYLTLKHITMCFGAQYSFIQPRYYTWIFISCDIVSLILQGAGGGIAATAEDYSKQKTGNSVSLAGIVFQVFTLLLFAALGLLYYVRRQKTRPTLTTEATKLLQMASFKLFILALILTYLGILIRCAYRIAEIAPGWRNSIMISEVDFMVLDGAIIGMSVLFLTVFHPGFCFPRLSNGVGGIKHCSMEKDTDSTGSNDATGVTNDTAMAQA